MRAEQATKQDRADIREAARRVNERSGATDPVPDHIAAAWAARFRRIEARASRAAAA